MKRKLVCTRAALVVGLMALGSSASAQLTYFDAQIQDINTGKSVVLHNTEWADGTLFTGSPTPTDPAGNWTENIGQPDRGQDGLWNQRYATPAPGNFGNPDPSGNGTIYESHGNSGGPNPENLPALKTTVNVPLVDQGQTRSVWALFWSDGSPWHIHASLWNQLPGDPNDAQFPRFVGGGSQSPSGYVYQVFDPGDVTTPSANPTPGPGDLRLEMAAGLTSTDAVGRNLWAAFLGDVALGATLTAYVGDGPALNATELANNGGANHRTWYDGIAYGPALGLASLPDIELIPEPTSVMLLAMGLVGCGISIRRRTR